MKEDQQVAHETQQQDCPHPSVENYLHAQTNEGEIRPPPKVYCIPFECGKVYVGQTDRKAGL
jgi:hypothetical protein